MAEIPTLEPATDVALDDGAAEPRGSAKLLIILIVATLLVAAAAGAGWYFLAGTHGKGKTSKSHAEPTGPPVYVALDPPFVTNFEADQAVRFLQISVEVMTHDPATAQIIKANDPVVRNDLLLLFANQKYTDISTRDGKERLRAAALAAVRKDVAANGGQPERVDAVYFTSFVMQ